MSGRPRVRGTTDIWCSGDWACSLAADGRHCVCVMDARVGRAGLCCQCGNAAQTALYAAGLTRAQMDTVTGFGLRRRDDCGPDDTILNKVASGALTVSGALAALFGVDSPEHLAGRVS